MVFPTKDEVWELHFLSEIRNYLEARLNIEFPINEMSEYLKNIQNYITNKLEGKIDTDFKHG
jgi:hypothetical protein